MQIELGIWSGHPSERLSVETGDFVTELIVSLPVERERRTVWQTPRVQPRMLPSPRASIRVIIIVAHPGDDQRLASTSGHQRDALRLLGPYPALKIGEPPNVMDSDLYQAPQSSHCWPASA